MDSEVQSNSSRTNKSAKNKLTKLYNKIENRSQNIKNKIGGTNDVEKMQKKEEALPIKDKDTDKDKVSDPLKAINERLTRHRRDLDQFNGIILRMRNVWKDTKQEISTLDDYNTLSKAVTLMKEQIEGIEKKIDDNNNNEEKDKVVQDLKTELEQTNKQVAEIEQRHSKTIASLQEAITDLRKKESRRKKRKEWVETPKMEDIVKQASTKAPVSKDNTPDKPETGLEEATSHPGKEQQEDVQEELGTLADIPPKVTI